MRILVTAGPTREHWDAVRFLTSAATGLLGIEVARAALAAGHEVVLVIGPTTLEVPDMLGLDTRRVVSALEMFEQCREAWPGCEAMIATAAVADYRPSEPVEGKRPKGEGPVSLDLTRNPDIVAECAATKDGRRVIGFALEVGDGEANAHRKLAAKHLDVIVLDSPSALGAEKADFRMLFPNGESMDFPETTKAELAAVLVELVSAP